MRRTFSTEFKIEAVKLITERGYSIAQACRELGIDETALRCWMSQVEAENRGYVLAQAQNHLVSSCNVLER